MSWFVGDVEIDHIPFAEEFVGVVYLITNLIDGRKYLGQKTFLKTVELSGEVERLGGESFKREILHFCRTKSEMNYIEAREIFLHDAVISPRFYNKWVSVKVSQNQLQKLKIP